MKVKIKTVTLQLFYRECEVVHVNSQAVEKWNLQSLQNAAADDTFPSFLNKVIF